MLAGMQLQITARRSAERSCGRLIVLSLLLNGSGCLETHIVNLNNLATHVLGTARTSWQSAVEALLERYETAPVLNPGDEHLDPIFGGLSTLTYYGADLIQKAQDQQIPENFQAAGASAAEICAPPELSAAAPASDAPPAAEETPHAVEFKPLWIPIASTGGVAPDEARCDANGHALDAEQFGHFCMFGRLALQSASGRPLIVVVHGLFDSSAQLYVERMGRLLYALGYSVLLPDMRDHGNTFRVAPQVASTLGNLEGDDVLALVAVLRAACGKQISTAGAVGVSGGGLDVIRAFSLDRQHALAAGVIAISPLLDVDAAVSDVSSRGSCVLSRALELTWAEELGISIIAGAIALGGALAVDGLQHHEVDGESAALVTLGGAGVGLIGGLAIDRWGDGGLTPCVSQNAIANLFSDMLAIRWRSLNALENKALIAPCSDRLAATDVTLGDYVRDRIDYLGNLNHRPVVHFTAAELADGLHQASTFRGPGNPRLLVIGADDDPVTRLPALHEFSRETAAMKTVFVRSVSHGGHGAMWAVQPMIMKQLFQRFFADAGDEQLEE